MPGWSRWTSRSGGSPRPRCSGCCGADGVPVQHVYNGETYERTFDGVARKLERLHVDKDEDQIPEVGRLGILDRLIAGGNTVVVVEHNLMSSQPPTGSSTWGPRGAGTAGRWWPKAPRRRSPPGTRSAIPGAI